MIFALALLILSAEDSDIPSLVRQLGAEDYKVRDEATQSLIKTGKSALAAIDAAICSKDLEVVARARAIRRRIQHQILRQQFPGGKISHGYQMALRPLTESTQFGTGSSIQFKLEVANTTDQSIPLAPIKVWNKNFPSWMSHSSGRHVTVIVKRLDAPRLKSILCWQACGGQPIRSTIKLAPGKRYTIELCLPTRKDLALGSGSYEIQIVYNLGLVLRSGLGDLKSNVVRFTVHDAKSDTDER